jgi:hypothetical protein
MKAVVKMASAFLRTEKIFLYPYSRTTKGFWIACEPILVTSGSDEGLGEQVLQTLAKSTENIPHPGSLALSDSWNSTKALVRAGVSSRMKPLPILRRTLESGSMATKSCLRRR